MEVILRSMNFKWFLFLKFAFLSGLFTYFIVNKIRTDKAGFIRKREKLVQTRSLRNSGIHI